jgi:hypothetical protein
MNWLDFFLWFCCAVWIFVLGDVAWSLLRKPPRSSVHLARLFGRAVFPLTSLILVLTVLGQRGGWLYDGAESTLTWTALALSIVALAWAIGQKRLMKVLAARAAAKRGQ